MIKLYLLVIYFLLLCGNNYLETTQEQKALAEQYFRGVYGCDSTVVDNLGADNITISYPIFQKIFKTPAIRGRDAARHFVSHFCSRFSETQITFHDAIAESNKVVLVWSCKARNNGSLRPSVPPTDKIESWGGITLIRFNEAGKIEAEIGEESSPGPIARIMQNH